MPKYFLHLRDSTDELIDREGVDLADLEALREHVARTARDVIAGDLRTGIIDLRYRIDAETEDGEVVYSLPFKHAFTIIPESADE